MITCRCPGAPGTRGSRPPGQRLPARRGASEYPVRWRRLAGLVERRDGRSHTRGVLLTFHRGMQCQWLLAPRAPSAWPCIRPASTLRAGCWPLCRPTCGTHSGSGQPSTEHGRVREKSRANRLPLQLLPARTPSNPLPRRSLAQAPPQRMRRSGAMNPVHKPRADPGLLD